MITGSVILSKPWASCRIVSRSSLSRMTASQPCCCTARIKTRVAYSGIRHDHLNLVMIHVIERIEQPIGGGRLAFIFIAAIGRMDGVPF